MDLTPLLPKDTFMYVRYSLGADGLDMEDSWYGAQQVWAELKGLTDYH